jgi:hypothetical protein
VEEEDLEVVAMEIMEVAVVGVFMPENIHLR